MGFLIFGLSENIRGPAVPFVQSDLSLSEFQLGFLFALNSLGYLIACGYTGWVCRRMGVKPTLVVCFISMSLSGLLIFLSRTYPSFVASYFILYLGNGMLEIALGIMAATIFVNNTGTMMNLSHFFYGLGSMVAPLAATGVMRMNIGGPVGWRGMYLFMLSLCLLPIVPALMGSLKRHEEDEKKKLSLKQYIRDPIAWLIVMVLSFGVTCEMNTGGWFVNFLEKTYGYTGPLAAARLSGFFLCFMLSRLLLGPIIDKVGLARSLAAVSLFAALSIIIGTLIGKPGVILIMISGFGISPIYPTVMAVISKLYKDNLDTAMSFTLVVMGLMIVLGNLMVGSIIDLFKNLFTSSYGEAFGVSMGYKAGFIFLGLCSLICFAGAMTLIHKLKKKGQLV